MGPAEKELRENGRKQEQGNGLEISVTVHRFRVQGFAETLNR